MIVIFYLLAATLIFLSYRSLRRGIDYLHYVKAELARPPAQFLPFASIIVPCKGVDHGLRENLTALLRQEYREYEIIFVIDDADDPAVSTIEDVSREAAKKTIKLTTVIAPKAVISSQKVENLREAVLHADVRSEIFVFADSDARPSARWLCSLVAPLEDSQVGASTGYRWFISEKPNFASELLSAWNASIASALGKNTQSNFCWGGSMAVRRDVFDRLNIRERWHGTLSDDFTVTRAVHEAGLNIYFVPAALTPAIENCSFVELVEFTTRQMKITRVYAPDLWKLSFFGSALFNTTLLWALMIVASSAPNTPIFLVALATVIVVSAFSIAKSCVRLRGVRLILTDYQELRRQFWTQAALCLFTPALFLYNCAAALFSRKVVWRGITYGMISPTETLVRKS